MNFTAGFAAAVLEMTGALKASQWVYDLARRDGRRMNGYDAAYSILQGI